MGILELNYTGDPVRIHRRSNLRAFVETEDQREQFRRRQEWSPENLSL